MYAYVHYEKRKASHDAKPIVDEIKAKLKGKKFYPGDHVARARHKYTSSMTDQIANVSPTST